MIRGIINSSLPIHERGNSSIFIGIGEFVVVGRKFEATRHQLIGERFREALALLIILQTCLKTNAFFHYTAMA